MNPRPAATGWEQHVRGIAADTVRWVDVVSVQLFVEELDRTRAELSETRRAHKDAEQLWLRCRSELAQVHTHEGAAVAIGQFETAGQVPATVAAKTGPYPHPGNEGDIVADPCRHSADGYVELVPAAVRDTTALDLLRELVAAIDNERADDMTPLWTRARALLAGQSTTPNREDADDAR